MMKSKSNHTGLSHNQNLKDKITLKYIMMINLEIVLHLSHYLEWIMIMRMTMI